VKVLRDLDEVVGGADCISIMTGHLDYFKLDPLWVKEMTGQKNNFLRSLFSSQLTQDIS